MDRALLRPLRRTGWLAGDWQEPEQHCRLWREGSGASSRPSHCGSAHAAGGCPFCLRERKPAGLCRSLTMASGRRGWDSSHEDDLPVYLARPGTTDQVPRQKYGGMFCNVEGAFESKTLDFDALSVGQRGAKTPRSSQGSGRASGSRPGLEDSPRRGQGREESREPAPVSPAPAGVEIRSATGKEVLQNLGPKDKVGGPGSLICLPLFPAQPGAPCPRHNFLLLTLHGDGGLGGGKGHPLLGAQ